MAFRLNTKSVFVGCFIGAAGVTAGSYASDAADHIERISEPSNSAVAKPLKPLTVDTSWVKSGNPNFRIAWQTQTPDMGSGIWECEGPTTFEWTFHADEHVYVLEGAVDIEYLGNRFTLKPGDTALFFEGTKATWHVDKYLKKSFTIEHPNLAVRLYRRVVKAG